MNSISFPIANHFKTHPEKLPIGLIIEIADAVASQYEYNFDKQCTCEDRPGETWCCNLCGLPVKHENKQVLLIASVGNSSYFAILSGRYIVVHASTLSSALEWLENSGYTWTSVENIATTNIY